MRNLAHLAARLYNAPLLLQPGAADAIGRAFGSMLLGESPTQIVMVGAQHGQTQADALEPMAYSGNVQRGSRFDGKPYTVTADGVALLPVLGPLLQRSGQIDANCMPIASYQSLRARYDAMMADADVRAILMEFDSPGGEAAGMFDLAQHITATRGNKPVWGHANEAAYSAGYGLASAVERLHAPQGGSVGSVGVVLLHMDQSQRDAKQGLVFTPIYAGARKVDFNSHAPLSAEAMASAQSMVDALYDQFTAQVASARGMPVDAVRATEAGILMAADAKAIGLVDDIASFSDTLAALTDHLRTRSSSSSSGRAGMSAATSSPTGSKSAAISPPKGNATMADSNPAADQAAITAARAEGHAAGLAAGLAQGRTEGASAERTRIGTVLNHEASGKRPKLAAHLALGTDMAADAAVAVLQAAAEEGAGAAAAAPAAKPGASGPLAAAMASATNPAVGADAGATGAGNDETPQATAKNVIALLNTARGAKA